MKSAKRIVVLIFCLVSFLPSGLSQNISALQADSLIMARGNDTTFVILDVRTGMEYQQGHLENSLQINYLDRKDRKRIYKLDKDKAYLIYCRTDGRTTKLSGKMKIMGFKEVYNMVGGIKAWQNADLPVIK